MPVNLVPSAGLADVIRGLYTKPLTWSPGALGKVVNGCSKSATKAQLVSVTGALESAG